MEREIEVKFFKKRWWRDESKICVEREIEVSVHVIKRSVIHEDGGIVAMEENFLAHEKTFFHVRERERREKMERKREREKAVHHGREKEIGAMI